MNPLQITTTLARRGVIGPGLPHLQLGQLAVLARWGFGLAGELRQAAVRSGPAVAIHDEAEGPVTYAELLARSEDVAQTLQDRGLRAGDRIGVLARNHAGAVAAMVGTSILGADLVLLNTGLGAEQLGLVADRQGLDAVIHDDEFGPALGDLGSGVALVGESELATAVLARTVDGAPRRSLGPPTRAGRTVILTSGTTGTPKGAARRTPGGFGPLVSIIDRIPVRARDTVLISAPLFHTWGYAAFQLALAMRGTVVLRRRFEAADARDALARFDCRAMFAVPVMLQRMMELPAYPDGPARDRLPRLRVVATSGSAYPTGFATRFMDEYGDVLYNLYGSTEASWVCIATPVDLRRDPDTAGTPPLGTTVRILDDEGAEVGEGLVGRVFCGNEFTFEGYTSGERSGIVDGLVDTGDLGHVQDGLFFVDGRADDMIVSGGENVYPIEAEGLLHEHPAIRDVAVGGIPDPQFGQRLAAFVVLEPGATLSDEEVRDYVRTHRARHVVPREVRFVAALPRNATGKVLLGELRRRFGFD